jgi:hypothetical protein
MMLNCNRLAHTTNMRREVTTPLLGMNITYYFTAEETNRLADGASVASAIGGAVPDPVVGPMIALIGTIINVWAKSAVRRGKCIAIRMRVGVLTHGPIPFEYTP